MIYLWYNLNIKKIFMEYQRYIIIKIGTEQTQKCFTMYIPSICMTSTYDWNIPCIYHVYTIIYQTGGDIPVIYQEYSVYILHCMYLEYTLYILHIYKVYQFYKQCIYQVCIWNMLCIYTVYKLNMHSILCVYSTPCCWISADVGEEGRVPFHQLHQQSHSLDG